MPKEYSTKFKTEVIKRYQNGESILALSQELRIAQSTIYHWRKEFCSIKAANRIYTPKEFDALSRRLEKLEHEMEIIKRSGYIADVPLQKKLSVLENIYRQADNTYSVHELCEALDIARGTFYNYIFRRADHSKREEAQIELMRLVQQVFDDSSQRFGAEKTVSYTHLDVYKRQGCALHILHINQHAFRHIPVSGKSNQFFGCIQLQRVFFEQSVLNKIRAPVGLPMLSRCSFKISGSRFPNRGRKLCACLAFDDVIAWLHSCCSFIS